MATESTTFPTWLLVAIFVLLANVGCNQNRYQPAEWRTISRSNNADGTMRWTTLPGSTLPGSRMQGTTLPGRFSGTTLPEQNPRFGTTLPR